MEKTEKTTPMLAQYQEIKAQYPNYVLFFRLGDFFEMFKGVIKVKYPLEINRGIF